MSFRTRLIGFFVIIVLLPMVAIGALFYQVIANSEQGKTDAQATGLATAAGSVYQHALLVDRADAHRLAFDSALLRARGARLRLLMAEAGLKRVVLTQSGRTLVDMGDPTAIAPGLARVSFPGSGRPRLDISVSSLSAKDFVGELETASDAVVVSQGARQLAASVDVPPGMRFARRATITLDRVRYREVTLAYPGFGVAPVNITLLSTYGVASVGARRAQALALVAGLLVLALAFAVLSSRALQAQVRRFLQAARRLGSGDFSDPIDTVGNDEFAALATEFNNMSQQLDRRLHELTAERARLRESVRRIGQTFAANLDRPALVTLALQTAIDATESDCGRVRVSDGPSGGPLTEAARHGLPADPDGVFDVAEHAALSSEELGRGRHGDLEILSVALRAGPSWQSRSWADYGRASCAAVHRR